MLIAMKAKVRDPAVAQPAAIAQAPVVDHQATVQAILASLVSTVLRGVSSAGSLLIATKSKIREA